MPKDTSQKNNLLLDIIRYIDVYKNTEINLDISVLSKILYLIDWKTCIEHGTQLTQLEWTNGNFGITCDHNLSLAYDLATRIKKSILDLNTSDTNIINFILEKTYRMKYTDFAHLVQCTYPMIFSEKYEVLDLVKYANEYKIYKKENL